ncbi:hypothetical protein EDD86DRAFT_217140 [Gorgonomyces haynaldii]|nr:hypothetical protein EDD86DRAFT_217140 [Gorgonomyces haynaldii]
MTGWTEVDEVTEEARSVGCQVLFSNLEPFIGSGEDYPVILSECGTNTTIAIQTDAVDDTVIIPARQKIFSFEMDAVDVPVQLLDMPVKSHNLEYHGKPFWQVLDLYKAVRKYPATIEQQNEYLALLFAAKYVMEECYLHPIWCIQRFCNYCLRQCSDAKLLNRFEDIFLEPGTDPSSIVIYMGDWHQRRPSRGSAPQATGKYSRNLFRKLGYRVVIVNEFRTSVRCYNCSAEMAHPDVEKRPKMPDNIKHIPLCKLQRRQECLENYIQKAIRDFEWVLSSKQLDLYGDIADLHVHETFERNEHNHDILLHNQERISGTWIDKRVFCASRQ